MLAYGMLAVAIVVEVIGTTFLKLSDGMTRLLPAIVVVACYASAFWLMAQIVRTLPVGLVYALWSGVGIAGVKAIGVVFFKEALDLPAIAGTALIIAGIAVLHLGPHTPAH
jgi:small multidrug resistance pump